GRGLLAPVRPEVPRLREPAMPRPAERRRALQAHAAGPAGRRGGALTTADVLVVGGGLTGLVTGFWASRLDPGARVVVLEAGRRGGGKACTVDVAGFAGDTGPGTLVLEPSATGPLLEALGLADEVEAPATDVGRRFLVSRGRLVPVPTGPGGFLAWPLLS